MPTSNTPRFPPKQGEWEKLDHWCTSTNHFTLTPYYYIKGLRFKKARRISEKLYREHYGREEECVGRKNKKKKKSTKKKKQKKKKSTKKQKQNKSTQKKKKVKVNETPPKTLLFPKKNRERPNWKKFVKRFKAEDNELTFWSNETFGDKIPSIILRKYGNQFVLYEEEDDYHNHYPDWAFSNLGVIKYDRGLVWKKSTLLKDPSSQPDYLLLWDNKDKPQLVLHDGRYPTYTDVKGKTYDLDEDELEWDEIQNSNDIIGVTVNDLYLVRRDYGFTFEKVQINKQHPDRVKIEKFLLRKEKPKRKKSKKTTKKKSQ